jgi:sensor histidine kinase YesM
MSINSKQTIIALHIFIWSNVLILPYFFIPSDGHQPVDGILLCHFFTITNLLHIGLFYFNAFFLYEKFLTRARSGFYILIVAILVPMLYYFKSFILITWFSGLSQEESAFAFMFAPIVVFLVLSTFYRLIADKINHEKEQLALELKFLRSQISPHFLFNVHNNLVSMARHKSDLLEPSLVKLSSLMRYMIYESNEKKISLLKELDYLRSYIELQEIRFGEDVSIKKNIEEASATYSLEPMLLIPFVENAFKHGVVLVADPFIDIQASIDKDVLHFSVRNRFENENQTKDDSSGIGLANVRARLNLLYPKRHRLEIKAADHIYHVELSINFT